MGYSTLRIELGFFGWDLFYPYNFEDNPHGRTSQVMYELKIAAHLTLLTLISEMRKRKKNI